MIKKIAELLGGKNPKKMIDPLQMEIQSLKKSLKDLAFDQKKETRKQESIIQKGVKAAKDGDHFLKQSMASQLKSQNAILSTIERQRREILGSLSVAEVALRKIKYARVDDARSSIEKIKKLTEGKEWQNLLAQDQVDAENISDWIEKQMDGMEQPEQYAAADTSIFDQLAQAEEKGDDKKVSKLRSQLTNTVNEENQKFEEFEI